MNCTSCKKGELRPAYLDDLFPCHTCSHCGGNWIYLSDYLRWLEQNADNGAPFPESDMLVEARETSNALLCPKTGRIMVKYRISRDSEHRLDFSPECNGIWLDKGEWELLKKQGLARELNLVFTDQWQHKIRAASTEEMLRELYVNEFGEADYLELKKIREWLAGKEAKSSMLAFLLDENPFAVK